MKINRQRRERDCDLAWLFEIEAHDPPKLQHYMPAIDAYFQAHVNSVIFAMFQRYKSALPEESVFARTGAIGSWLHCPHELADEVERLLNFAAESVLKEVSKPWH